MVVDTLRADRLGFYGYEQPTSPGLNGWARRGVVFERAVSAAPWTLPSVASMLTGRYPASHGAGRGQETRPNGKTRRVFLGLGEEIPTLAEVVASSGYATGAFVTNSFLREEFHLDRGFEEYDFARNRFLSERRADFVVDRALEWATAQESKPYFLLVHILDPHMPYDPAEEDRGLFTSGYAGQLEVPLNSRQMRRVKRGLLEFGPLDQQWVGSLYDEQLPFVDRQVSRLLTGLEELGVLDRGLVFLTSDHGEEFWDHGGFEHGHTMYQELLRVPLIVWGPGLEPRRLDEPVSGVDLLPTVLEALDLELPSGTDGVSLWPLLIGSRGPAERPLLAQNTLFGSQEEALLRWPHKLIWNRDRGQGRLFNLEEDALEKNDLAAQEPELFEQLRLELESLKPREVSAQVGVELSDDTRADLEALGYLEEDD